MLKRITALFALAAFLASSAAIACPGDKAKDEKQSDKPKTSLIEIR